MTGISEHQLPARTLTAIADAYGLGEARGGIYVGCGAMGVIHRLDTVLHGARRYWTVKRSYWNQFTEHKITMEVDFTSQCESVGVPAPRSIQRVDGGGYVLTVDDRPNGGTQYRVLEWIDGEVGRSDDPRTIPPIADWMARIHNLAVDSAGHSIDQWYVHVTYDWDDLAGRLARRAPDVAEHVRTHRADIRELTDLVNTTQESGAVWCHTDIGADNLVWGHRGPQLIDWDDAGPLIPHQELGCRVRSLGPLGSAAYRAYQQAGGPAEIADVTHLASSVAVQLNYLGCQAELLLDDDHVEHHDFARAQLAGAVQSLPNLHVLDQLVKKLRT
jgi:hypothetical protein